MVSDGFSAINHSQWLSLSPMSYKKAKTDVFDEDELEEGEAA